MRSRAPSVLLPLTMGSPPSEGEMMTAVLWSGVEWSGVEWSGDTVDDKKKKVQKSLSNN